MVLQIHLSLFRNIRDKFSFVYKQDQAICKPISLCNDIYLAKSIKMFIDKNNRNKNSYSIYLMI